jgi:hypothetical protein
MKKVSMKLIQNASEFISEHEVVLKIPGLIWWLLQILDHQEYIIKTKPSRLLKYNNLIFIGSRANDAFFTPPKNEKDWAEIPTNDLQSIMGNLVRQVTFL